MTGRDPLAEWTPADAPYDTDHPMAIAWYIGANERLDALHPLIAAAAELAADVLRDPYYDGHARTAAHRVRDLTTKEGTPP